MECAWHLHTALGISPRGQSRETRGEGEGVFQHLVFVHMLGSTKKIVVWISIISSGGWGGKFHRRFLLPFLGLQHFAVFFCTTTRIEHVVQGQVEVPKEEEVCRCYWNWTDCCPLGGVETTEKLQFFF